MLPGHICLTLAHFQVSSSTKTRSIKDINLGSHYTALAKIQKKKLKTTLPRCLKRPVVMNRTICLYIKPTSKVASMEFLEVESGHAQGTATLSQAPERNQRVGLLRQYPGWKLRSPSSQGWEYDRYDHKSKTGILIIATSKNAAFAILSVTCTEL